MSLLAAISVDDILARGAVTEADVLQLRRSFYADGIIDRAEAESMFAIHRGVKTHAAGWGDCFVEMLTDHIVQQAKPEGYLTIENAGWLASHIAPNGQIESRDELELLINVLDKARWSPQSLAAFALEQVRRGVVEGAGPLRTGTSIPAGTIQDADVEMLKRILYAFGGDGNIAVTRAEAEVLFDIDAATDGAANAESWPDLFTKAIANCVMAASGYAAPSREQVLAREAWVERRGDAAPGAVVGSMLHTGLGGILSAYREQSPEERAIAALERQKIEIITAEEVTVAEAQWLADRIGRDGKISSNEQALLDFIIAQSPKVAPELRALTGKAKRVA
jgi:hypothetical protein